MLTEEHKQTLSYGKIRDRHLNPVRVWDKLSGIDVNKNYIECTLKRGLYELDTGRAEPAELYGHYLLDTKGQIYSLSILSVLEKIPVGFKYNYRYEKAEIKSELLTKIPHGTYCIVNKDYRLLMSQFIWRNIYNSKEENRYVAVTNDKPRGEYEEENLFFFGNKYGKYRVNLFEKDIITITFYRDKNFSGELIND